MGFRIYLCKEERCLYVSLPNESGNLDLLIGNSSLDFKTGRLTTDFSSELPERIASLFILGVLTALCVPRPDSWVPGMAVSTGSTTHLCLNTSVVGRACGLHVRTPSNAYRSAKRATQKQFQIGHCGDGVAVTSQICIFRKKRKSETDFYSAVNEKNID